MPETEQLVEDKKPVDEKKLTAKSTEENDWLLKQFVRSANMGMELSMTVFVGGAIIK